MKLLIADTDQLKEFVNVNAAFDFGAIKPYILPAQQVIERYIGPTLLDEIITASYDEAEAAPDVLNSLIDLVRMPVATLALLNYAGTNNVQVTEMGVSRTNTGAFADAFEWQYEGFRRELSRNAYDGIEALLRYLEQNVDDVPAYKASEAYQLDKNLLIRSATVFSRYYFIDNSRLVFQTLLPSLRTAQDRRVWPVLGTEVLYPLIDADIAGTLTADQMKQLRCAQQALTYATIARALRERLIQIGEGGLTVNGVNTIAYKKPVDEKSLQRSIDYFISEADQALSDLAALTVPTTPVLVTVGISRVQGDRIVSF